MALEFDGSSLKTRVRLGLLEVDAKYPVFVPCLQHVSECNVMYMTLHICIAQIVLSLRFDFIESVSEFSDCVSSDMFL